MLACCGNRALAPGLRPLVVLGPLLLARPSQWSPTLCPWLGPEQIIRILRESEGLKVEDACRKHSISTQTYHRWKAKYGGMGLAEG
jgi:hypothetical protein